MAAVATQMYHPAKYDHLAVDSMFDIDVSAKRLQELDGWSHIKSCIRDVFIRHNVNEKFGVGLLHRHYDISPNEKIVELGPVSTPQVVGDDEEITGGSVLPHTWRVHEGELKPTEFRFVAQRDVAGTQRAEFPAGFVQELIAVIESAALENVLGINMIKRGGDQEKTMEITYGRSSIIIPAVPVEGDNVLGPQSLAAFEAAWSFTNDRTRDRTGDGVRARHSLCVKNLSEEVTGVQTRHSLCVKNLNSEETPGVQTRHSLCVKNMDSEVTGVQAQHSLCVKNINSDASGVQTRHSLCVKNLDAGEAPGVRTRHSLCVKNINSDASGVKTRHSLCVKNTDSEAHGVQIRHSLCAKNLNSKESPGVQTRHNLCVKNLDAGEASGVQTRHSLCVKNLKVTMEA
ncbi:hypothetical protein Daus18300_002063 [Diaporthe australafricana]|uniref:Uncharacterized protein n=1 Tax=Diaporthe australafricana TaxID=127596 RepID=A0ABR3XQ74_9PEZI